LALAYIDSIMFSLWYSHICAKKGR